MREVKVRWLPARAMYVHTSSLPAKQPRLTLLGLRESGGQAMLEACIGSNRQKSRAVRLLCASVSGMTKVACAT